ncbi:N-acetyltransferase family protein [Anaeroselena agilis]|uniref:GNAT family N-acetyltransferase n=1 Tax=Anaeroselena agilis TaxID=3063788 RepID=A0ABU3P4M3_9FIRM|nr:GNAT family N-acetyltransferase [Selenomonadales bacterium 4137-cl]
MEIRALTEDDIPALAGLYKQFWGEESDPAAMRAQFRRLAAAGSHLFLGAVLDGRLVGSVMGVVCGELYGPCRPFLVVENMIVDAPRRGCGIGKALLAALEKRAAERGCGQAILVTEADRPDACAFYAAAGYPAGAHRGFKKKLG